MRENKMCGICGISWQDKRLIEAIKSKIAHRGPDSHGTYIDKNVSFGHQRLAIIDLSPKGHQPMVYDNLVITFNGEIYNYQELIKELKKLGHKFTSKSDTEMILAAYKEWGPAMLNRFNGMWAFAIYDKSKKELFISRDRFGIKPLYYVYNKRGTQRLFSFCSEIKGLVNQIIEPKISKKGLEQYFTFRFTLGETTMLEGVKKLLPGHYMVYDLNAQKITSYEQYYQLKPQVQENKSLKYYKKELRHKFSEAVKRRMIADVPVASFLSGGIDSSTIVMEAKKHNSKLNTFSMGFDTTNELPFAELVAKKFNTKHHNLMLDNDSVLDYIDLMNYHMDEPIGDPGFLPMFTLSEEVSKHNKVVLSGDGGDEVLVGYDRYKMFYYGQWIKYFIPSDFGKDILKRAMNMRGKDQHNAFIEIIRLFEKQELKQLNIKEATAKFYWNDFQTRVETAEAFDMLTLLPNDFFMKADKMSCAFGLEQRVPFLDHEFVEFCFSIPLKYKLKGWNEKHILKKSYVKELKEITKRRKHGFNVPIDHWFKNTLGEKLRKLLDKKNHNLYNKKYIYELLNAIKDKDSNYKENFIMAQKLWTILMFEIWYEKIFNL